MSFKAIEKPKRAPNITERALLTGNEAMRIAYGHFLRRVQEENYYPWSIARHVAKELRIPPEAAWESLLIQRSAFRRIQTPICTPKGDHFCFGIQTSFWAFAHRLDQGYCGHDNIAESLTEERHRYLVEGIMEEAIASSQLEGSKTTRSAGLALLKSGRAALTSDEKMVVNNFRALNAVEERFVREEFTISNILELHAILVEGLLDDEGETPRLREKDEKIFVSDKLTGDIFHEGPHPTFVRKELNRLCYFANSSVNDTGTQFTHPFIKAVELHFWIGYLHSFTDGNGRLARTLFYWYLLRRGYWAAAFLPISSVLKEAREEYPRAYQHSEQDNFDLTYFIDFNVRKMSQAMDRFEVHRSKVEERIKKRRNELSGHDLNHRQLILLDYLMRHPEQTVSVRSHMLMTKVVKQTAISDYQKLIASGLLEKLKEGREVRYRLIKKV